MRGTLLVTMAVWAVATSCDHSPNLGIFDIQFNITLTNSAAATTQSNTVTGSTTQSSLSSTAMSNLTECLYQVFKATPGFVTVSVPTEESNINPLLVMEYAVVYNKTVLNDNGMLSPNNTAFTSSLTTAAANLSAVTLIFDSYTIDSSATSTSMNSTIDSVVTEFSSSTWSCIGSDCGSSGTCVWNATMSMACCLGSACQLFTNYGTTCSQPPYVPGVYVQGACLMNDYEQPYCDCGYSAGNVMANFYDGTQCVSSTFIVAMAASAGGALFILCLLLMCIINKQRDAVELAKQAVSKYKIATPATAKEHDDGLTTSKAMYEYNDETINKIVKPEVHRSDSRHSDNTTTFVSVSPNSEYDNGAMDSQMASAQL